MLRPWKLVGGTGRLRLSAFALGVIAFAFVVTGCEKLTGGGWIPSLMPGEKATFGFSARCKDSTTDLGVPVALLYEGQFEFDDHAADPRVVRVHGDVDPQALSNVVGQTCADVANDTDVLSHVVGEFGGTYRTQPKVGPIYTGDFVVDVFDGGEGGTINGDMIGVHLSGGVTYNNVGEVQGGNIQVH
jgi:hypothetical protein